MHDSIYHLRGINNSHFLTYVTKVDLANCFHYLLRDIWTTNASYINPCLQAKISYSTDS